MTIPTNFCIANIIPICAEFNFSVDWDDDDSASKNDAVNRPPVIEIHTNTAVYNNLGRRYQQKLLLLLLITSGEEDIMILILILILFFLSLRRRRRCLLSTLFY